MFGFAGISNIVINNHRGNEVDRGKYYRGMPTAWGDGLYQWAETMWGNSGYARISSITWLSLFFNVSKNLFMYLLIKHL